MKEYFPLTQLISKLKRICIPGQEEFHTQDGQKAEWFKQSWMDIKCLSRTTLMTNCKLINRNRVLIVNHADDSFSNIIRYVSQSYKL